MILPYCEHSVSAKDNWLGFPTLVLSQLPKVNQVLFLLLM